MRSTDSPFAKARTVFDALVHAGVPAGTSRSRRRELVVANVVMLFATVVTIPDVANYFRFRTITTFYAGICAGLAVIAYVIGFLLSSYGRRSFGIGLFCVAVLLNLFFLTIILGTDCGTQYFFVAVGIGCMFVWPYANRHMRVPVGILGLALFLLANNLAHATPYFGERLPVDVVSSIFLRQTVGAYVIVFALASHSIWSTERAEQALEREHAQSESLLLNILPASIAARLKQNPGAIADSFNNVSILFADVVAFTPMSENLEPEAIVSFLNDLFCRFDQLVERHSLEKIKTIGDAYMIACGIPLPRVDHARIAAIMALDMLGVAESITDPHGRPVNLRIGIASGPAVAGVIGKTKFTYDIWGDTVNTAARMEANGKPGRIQTTEATYRLLKDEFQFEARGIIEIKGKGPMPLFFLTGRA